MTFLIIGAAGFIGQELSKYLYEKGHAVIACDKNTAIASNQNEKYVFCDADSLEANPDCLKADCMVILAAKRPVANFGFEDYLMNIQIFYRYYTLAVEYGIKNIVFASSISVYSAANPLPWEESCYAVSINLYGASKLACEQIALLAPNKSISFKSLRFGHVIGSGERKGYLINTLIDNALNKQTQVIYSSGSQKRHYVYIKDVCRAVLCAAENNSACGVFNIGMENAVTNLEMAECVNDVFDNKGNIYHDYNKKMGSLNDEMSVLKAKNELGFTVKYDLKAAFEDIAKEQGK